ncbi:MAG: 2-phospho-L-lactate transferase CofD family protein [Desulfurivibrio sp.]|nr:2-phospho-L-lactate transferase CofD family protein [Desulfurivibrio sp.]
MAEQAASIGAKLAQLAGETYNPLDLLPYGELPEKLLALALNGVPAGPERLTAGLAGLASALAGVDTSGVRVVVFGGGTGLANIIGGESRHPHWPENPFAGLKEIFPQTTAVVCVTDDGGSTGELLKDLPLIALGDLRHVLLASIRRDRLAHQYGLNEAECRTLAARLHQLFNCRFAELPPTPELVPAVCGVDFAELPPAMGRALRRLVEELYCHEQLQELHRRPHCLGNLLLVAAIYSQPQAQPSAAILPGLRYLAELLGAAPEAVLPCTTTPATLKILYENGVLVSGEHKSATARRRCPVDRVLVEFADEPRLPPEVTAAVAAADIILFAPGSLYTSTIPALQVPGLAAAVRRNRRALKVMLTNLWVQAGETDLVRGESERRFHVSDLLRAYHRNIPGGWDGLFRQVLVVGMREIPGSILQNYALENKVPIYLDRGQVSQLGLTPLEAAIAAQHDFDGRRVVQHDPAAVARAIRVLWALRQPPPAGAEDDPEGDREDHREEAQEDDRAAPPPLLHPKRQTPDRRRRELDERLAAIDLEPAWRPLISRILWRHRDIPGEHLALVDGLRLIPPAQWRRCQQWDNVFSFYDPDDRLLKIRADIAAPEAGSHFEIALLVALGQSLLGNYAAGKEKQPITHGGETVGHVFVLTMREESHRRCFFDDQELARYLRLARMRPSASDPLRFTRLLNGREGFTPPGLLFGLTYAWYLDNRFAPHIEYKMSITRAEASDLVPEQLRISGRRQGLIDFFRQRVFAGRLPGEESVA